MACSIGIVGDNDVNDNDDRDGGGCRGVGRGVAGPGVAIVCLQDRAALCSHLQPTFIAVPGSNCHCCAVLSPLQQRRKSGREEGLTGPLVWMHFLVGAFFTLNLTAFCPRCILVCVNIWIYFTQGLLLFVCYSEGSF